MDYGFERYYVEAREKEGRIYTDDQLRQLPEIAAGHRHQQEWKVRKRSAEKLIRVLGNAKRPLSVLEIGCGNGWLAHLLSRLPGLQVTGVDLNTLELSQAQRVFGQQENLRFVAGDIRAGRLQGQPFDRIIFAAAIQYFPSLGEIIGVALNQLAEEGEIHILDTFFYDKKDLAGARKRSRDYYNSLGVPEMTAYYFHHLLEDLAPFSYQLYEPRSWLQRLWPGREPLFPWIIIKKGQVAA
jgi:protein-L-isoaspartate O-methyltransferase